MAEAPLICWLEECRKDSVPLVGGKCSSLGELINAGMRVPPGFALTTEGYRRFMAEAGIAREVSSMLVKLDPGDLEALDRVSAAIRARMDAAKPTLGVCLGAQLMAKALGAQVAPGPQKEIGWAPLALTEAGRVSVLGAFETTPVLHWHGDNFELPVNAVRLASTSACPNQAFAYGQNLLGLQFHIEVDPTRIEQWLIGHTVELAKAGIDPRELRRQAATLGRATAEKGKAALTAWLDGVGKR